MLKYHKGKDDSKNFNFTHRGERENSGNLQKEEIIGINNTEGQNTVKSLKKISTNYQNDYNNYLESKEVKREIIYSGKDLKDVLKKFKKTDYKQSCDLFMSSLENTSNYLEKIDFSQISQYTNNKNQENQENEILKVENERLRSLLKEEEIQPKKEENETNVSHNIKTLENMTKYMDSIIYLQSKVEKLEKQNYSLKKALKKKGNQSFGSGLEKKETNTTDNATSQSLGTNRIESLLKMQMNCMQEMLEIVQKRDPPQNVRVNEPNNIEPQQVTENRTYSDINFDESFDVTNLSNSIDSTKIEGKKKTEKPVITPSTSQNQVKANSSNYNIINSNQTGQTDKMNRNIVSNISTNLISNIPNHNLTVQAEQIGPNYVHGKEKSISGININMMNLQRENSSNQLKVSKNQNINNQISNLIINSITNNKKQVVSSNNEISISSNNPQLQKKMMKNNLINKLELVGINTIQQGSTNKKK